MYSTQEPLWANLCCVGICIVSECVFDVTCTCVNVLQVCVCAYMLNRNNHRGGRGRGGGGVLKSVCLWKSCMICKYSIHVEISEMKVAWDSLATQISEKNPMGSSLQWPTFKLKTNQEKTFKNADMQCSKCICSLNQFEPT